MTCSTSSCSHVVTYGFLGAGATFGQVYAVVVHAGVVLVLQQLFVTPLNYARGVLANPATLAAFVPMLDPATFLVRLLNAVDLFFVWWVMLLSIGIAVVCGRKTTPIAVGLFLVYGALAVAIAVVRTLLAA